MKPGDQGARGQAGLGGLIVRSDGTARRSIGKYGLQNYRQQKQYVSEKI
ncbi:MULTISPECIES: hypothetical protein [unclassified Bradyrhizobium]|nr:MULTISPECIES: hypothetical protein [unclassified Bradyrhizobium]